MKVSERCSGLRNDYCKPLYLAGVIFDRTRVLSQSNYSRVLTWESIRRCTATAYRCVLGDCTEIRCILRGRSRNRRVDRPLETRSPVSAAAQCMTELRRRPCTTCTPLEFLARQNTIPNSDYVTDKKFEVMVPHRGP